MLDREACERRVYRLATLLTGNPVAATAVIARVVDAQPDLRHLDSAHMDRLTVLRSREIAPGLVVDERIDVCAAEALAALSDQQREAWVFARVYRMGERDIARAMDCSVTATLRHLEQADVKLREAIGERSDSLPNRLLAYSMSLDVPRFYREQRVRKKRIRLTLIIAMSLLAALLIAWIAIEIAAAE